VAENRSDGSLDGMTGEDIEIAAGWDGEVGELTNALLEVRFLDGVEGSFQVHDWAEHNPWAASRGLRVQAAKAAASARWRPKIKRRERCAKDLHANCMPAACKPLVDGNADPMPTTQPNPITSDLTKPLPTTKPQGTEAPETWIPADAWQGFLEMRQKIRKPLTDRAVTLILKELAKLRREGNDAGSVLDQSTRNNWQDVYPLKGDTNVRSSISPRTQRNITALQIVKSRNADRFSGATQLDHGAHRSDG
jgi:hypothetical protein